MGILEVLSGFSCLRRCGFLSQSVVPLAVEESWKCIIYTLSNQVVLSVPVGNMYPRAVVVITRATRPVVTRRAFYGTFVEPQKCDK